MTARTWTCYIKKQYPLFGNQNKQLAIHVLLNYSLQKAFDVKMLKHQDEKTF